LNRNSPHLSVCKGTGLFSNLEFAAHSLLNIDASLLSYIFLSFPPPRETPI